MKKKIKIGAILALSLILLIATTNLLVIDTSADSIIDYSPEENDTISGTVMFWVNDTGNADRCELYIDGELVTYMTETGTSPDWQYSINTANWEDGRHLVQYKSIGGSGDDVVGVTVYFDNSQPVIDDITVYYPGLQSAAITGDEIYFTAKVTDPYSQIVSVSIDVSSINSTVGIDTMYDDGMHNDGAIGDDIYGSMSFVIDDLAGTGLYYVEVTAEDDVGDTHSEGIYVQVDETTPEIFDPQVKSPEGRKSFKNGDQLRIVLIAEDHNTPTKPGGIHEVYADCFDIGGSDFVRMYDDGLHGDQMAGDGHYGSELVTVNDHSTTGKTIDVYCIDIAGNMFETTVDVWIDNAPPAPSDINVDYPDDRGYVMDGETIWISVYDSGGGKHFYLDASSIGLGSSIPNATGALAWPSLEVNTGYNSGMFKLQISAYDGAYNLGTKDFYVQVLNPTPSVDIIDPIDGQTGLEGAYTIQANVFNNSVEISEVYLYLDQDKIGTMDYDTFSGYWEYDLLTSTYEDGYHTIGVEALDVNDDSGLNSVRVQFQNEVYDDVKCEIVDPLQDFVIAGIYDIKVSSGDQQEINSVIFTIEDWDSMTTTVFENVSMGYNEDSGYWEYTLDTTVIGEANYSLSVVATNHHGFDNSDTVNFQVGTQDGRAVRVELNLGSRGKSGWYFVSIPVKPFDKDLVNILNDPQRGIKSAYDKVMAYDSADGGWKTYVPGRADHFNNLKLWDQKMGVWIHMTTSSDLTIEGTIIGTSEMTLKPGWNMVGYPSNDKKSASTILPSEVTKIGIFDESAEYNVRYLTDLSTAYLNMYNGYWIYNSADHEVTWTVQY